jgi:hypothetical protein
MLNSSARGPDALSRPQGLQEARELAIGQGGVVLHLSDLGPRWEQFIEVAAPAGRVPSRGVMIMPHFAETTRLAQIWSEDHARIAEGENRQDHPAEEPLQTNASPWLASGRVAAFGRSR